MNANQIKTVRRTRRSQRVRRRVGDSGLPRLSVHRSLKHIYAQLVDARTGRTLCGVGSSAKALGPSLTGKSKTERAQVVGKEIARLATEKGVDRVVFDRGFARYHGRVKALADAAREGGLKF